MTFYKTMRATACAFFIAGSAHATTLTDQFSSFWVLGDSLSAFAGETGAPETARASDGPLWSEQIILDFDAADKDAESFARGAATAGLGRDDPKDLAGQTEELLDEVDRFGDDPLVAIWIGGNDVRPIIGGFPAQTSEDVFRSTLEALIAVDVRDFLVFEVPDVGATPLVQNLPEGFPEPDVFRDVASDLNDRFFGQDGVISELSPDVNVTFIETFRLTQLALTDPGFFGAAAAGPCRIQDPASGQVVQLAPCELTSFWDPFHPTTRLHSFVADEVRAAYVAPIPLPAAGWLLIAAVGGLVALRRRA